MELNREGVSESLGYLIIFGLVLTGIGLITLYGYPLLMQQESSANLRNMEQTMIVLQSDIKSLTYKLANYKETSLRVSGGTLFFYDTPATPEKFRIQSTGREYPPHRLLPRRTPVLFADGQHGHHPRERRRDHEAARTRREPSCSPNRGGTSMSTRTGGRPSSSTTSASGTRPRSRISRTCPRPAWGPSG